MHFGPSRGADAKYWSSTKGLGLSAGDCQAAATFKLLWLLLKNRLGCRSFGCRQFFLLWNNPDNGADAGYGQRRSLVLPESQGFADTPISGKRGPPKKVKRKAFLFTFSCFWGGEV